MAALINTEEIVVNESLVKEERLGKAHAFLVGHTTTIADPMVLDSIKRMSFLEIIA